MTNLTIRREHKLVDSPAFHVWTDALHARELARGARDRWNRGTYVRWAVRDAWTAFEASCEDALNTSGVGRKFRRNLDKAIETAGLPGLDWGRGTWQQVAEVHKARKDYTHPRIPQNRLWAPLAEAEEAIHVLREGIKAIYRHAGKPEPAWVDADADFGKPRSSTVNVVLRHSGIDENTPGALRIVSVSDGKEQSSELMPPGSEWRLRVEELVDNVQVPISKILVYEIPNPVPVFELNLLMRGAD